MVYTNEDAASAKNTQRDAKRPVSNRWMIVLCILSIAMLHLISNNYTSVVIPNPAFHVKAPPQDEVKAVNFTLVVAQHDASFEEATVLIKSMVFHARQPKSSQNQRRIRLNILTDPEREKRLQKFFSSMNSLQDDIDDGTNLITADENYEYPVLDVYFQTYSNKALQQKLSQIWRVDFRRMMGHVYHGYFTLAKAAITSLFDVEIVQGYNIFVDADAIFTDDPFTMWDTEMSKMIAQKTAIHMPGNCSCVLMMDFDRMRAIGFHERIGEIFRDKFARSRHWPQNGDQRLFVLLKSKYPHFYSKLDGRWEMSGCQHLLPYEDTSSWDLRLGIFHFNCCWAAKRRRESVFKHVVEGRCFRGMGKHIKKYVDMNLKGVIISDV